jgi:serine/threonine-protein kinase HipA
MSKKRDEQFRVYLYQKPVGRLLRREDFTRFVFDDSYLNDTNRSVLGLRFEDQPRERFAANMRLPSWFSNLLPEGQLREWIASQRRASVQREMELLAEVGGDLPGAVSVRSVDDPLPQLDENGDANGATLLEVGAEHNWRFSLAGIALKFSMLREGDRFVAPAYGSNGDWIVKLPDSYYTDVPRNEYAMMELARRIGIDAPETRLVERASIDAVPDRAWGKESYAYAIRRFDRDAARNLVHIEDMAQVRGYYPEDKYHGTFETVGNLYYRGYDVESLREFVRRLAFNVIIGNGDAHLKNWSLIYRDRRKPTIAPAYDLVATFVYRPSGVHEEDLGMRFGGSKRFSKVTPTVFAALDRRLKADADLEDIAVKLVRDMRKEWPTVEDLLSSNEKLRKQIGERIRNESKRFLGELA